MDHRLITIEEATVLLDRLVLDETVFGWQVMASTFIDIESRFDEWVNFPDAEQARAYIKDFSEESARQFIARAKGWASARQVRGLFMNGVLPPA